MSLWVGGRRSCRCGAERLLREQLTQSARALDRPDPIRPRPRPPLQLLELIGASLHPNLAEHFLYLVRGPPQCATLCGDRPQSSAGMSEFRPSLIPTAGAQSHMGLGQVCRYEAFELGVPTATYGLMALFGLWHRSIG